MSRAVIILLAALCFAGCVHRPTGLLGNTAHWQMALSVGPVRPRSLDPAQFQVQITDTHHRPVSGAAVSVQLAMPGMDMGRNTAALHETATPGTYTGTGRFTMPGDWRTTVSADLGAVHQSQAFPITVR